MRPFRYRGLIDDRWSSRGIGYDDSRGRETPRKVKQYRVDWCQFCASLFYYFKLLSRCKHLYYNVNYLFYGQTTNQQSHLELRARSHIHDLHFWSFSFDWNGPQGTGYRRAQDTSYKEWHVAAHTFQVNSTNFQPKDVLLQLKLELRAILHCQWAPACGGIC